MKKLTFLEIFIFVFLLNCFSFAQESQPGDFTNVSGNWDLHYENDYGYSFTFGKNYKAQVILYLNSASVIFRGIYTFEDKGILRINISEMKREEKVKNLNTHGAYKKAKSSYFLFNCKVIKEHNKSYMELIPLQIYIDGNTSEGYFEPLIKLEKKGK
ncbi:MAG TPA: hypothetical protein PKX79_13125 [Spirochaetota bacterium]|jgi:hypothetical protein|nr:hypothetical protein [Spirochaetota bacterium]OQA99640.1 MAG: hypothetical protein BWY23_00606 [Spirochaetes bacterium ADurb.Bin218]HOK03431.1 hypothetical protein [Spirochaetota bacterium]HOK93793.1 hypothetical protein [Spirochaetota bacterium]HON15032.1 hypothetical protein [Spirochaetota bacterium]